MLKTRMLNNLFAKQIEKGYKPLWVLHNYLKKTKAVELTYPDKRELMTKFDVGSSLLDDAIIKSKAGMSDESKALRQKYFLEQTFAKGVESKSFNRHVINFKHNVNYIQNNYIKTTFSNNLLKNVYFIRQKHIAIIQ